MIDVFLQPYLSLSQALAGVEAQGQDGIDLWPGLLEQKKVFKKPKRRKELIYHIDTAKKTEKEIRSNSHLRNLIKENLLIFGGQGFKLIFSIKFDLPISKNIKF